MTSAVTASIKDNGAFIAPIGGTDNGGWKIGYIDIGNKGDPDCVVLIGDVTEVRNAAFTSDAVTAMEFVSAAGVTASVRVYPNDNGSGFSANTFHLHYGSGTSSGFITYR